MAHRLGVDLLAAIGFADFGQEVAKRQNAFDHQLGDAEGRSDVWNGAALLDEPRKRLPLRYFVWIEAGEVFDQRGFQRIGVVTVLHDGAGQGIAFAALVGKRFRGEIAPPAGDDLEGFRLAVRPHKERHQHAARTHGWQDVGNVGRAFSMAHVERGKADPRGCGQAAWLLSFALVKVVPAAEAEGRRGGTVFAPIGAAVPPCRAEARNGALKGRLLPAAEVARPR